MRAGELVLSLASCSMVGWASWGRAGELALVVWVWKSWQGHQLRYILGPDLGI